MDGFGILEGWRIPGRSIPLRAFTSSGPTGVELGFVAGAIGLAAVIMLLLSGNGFEPGATFMGALLFGTLPSPGSRPFPMPFACPLFC